MHAHASILEPQQPKEGNQSLGVRATEGSCELPEMSVGNQTPCSRGTVSIKH